MVLPAMILLPLIPGLAGAGGSTPKVGPGHLIQGHAQRMVPGMIVGTEDRERVATQRLHRMKVGTGRLLEFRVRDVVVAEQQLVV